MDSKFIPQTRESVESAKKGFEYESFEYESRLDPSLVRAGILRARTKCGLERFGASGELFESGELTSS